MQFVLPVKVSSYLPDIVKLWKKIHVLEAVNGNKRKVLKK